MLHAPSAVGGNPQGLARAERELGADSISVVLDRNPFGYRADVVLGGGDGSRLRFEARRLRLLASAFRQDVVHFNFGRTILPPQLRMLDLVLLKRAGVAVAVTFQGDDVRRGDVARRLGGAPTLPIALPDRYLPRLDVERRVRVERFARYADLIYYLNPDLSHVLPTRARFVPYAHVDPREWTPRDPAPRGTPVIVHAPSDREVKGSRHLIEAVDALKHDGVAVELQLVEGLTNEEARQRYAHADLAVDQLYAGWYGGFAVEAMALGLPVVTYLRREDLGVVPADMVADLPVVETTAATIANTLRELLGPRRAELPALGARSRRFVERWHDPRAIAAQMIQDYARVVGRSAG